MVEGGMRCTKYLLFIFNLVFFIFGVTLIGVGAYVQIELSQYLDLFLSDINGPAVFLIVVGSIMLVISFFGCCGAIKENYCMVTTFAVLLGLIFLFEISAGIAGFVLQDRAAEFVKDEMVKSEKAYFTPGRVGVRTIWQELQHESRCCGVYDGEGYDEWMTAKTATPDTDVTDEAYLTSCCVYTNCTDINPQTQEDLLRQMGCYSELLVIITHNVYTVGAVGIAFAIIQIVGIVLSSCLAQAIRKEYDVV